METLNEKLVEAYADVLASDGGLNSQDVRNDLRKAYRLVREMSNWLETASYKLNEMDKNGLRSIHEITEQVEKLAKSMKIK